jgi:glycosyltransferase involved in cell wall biosynthesis
MATPRFSVIIPTYNRADCLQRCLNSLVAQTCQDFEVIVCDDGSTDQTCEVVTEFADRLPIQYYLTKHWGGPAHPRNIGIEKANGEWVCFLDSDDWWYPQKLEICLPLLSNYDVIYHMLDVVSPAGVTGKHKGRDLHSPISADLLVNLNALSNSAVMVRLALLRQVGGVCEDRGIIGVEDFDLWIRISQKTERFHRIPLTLGACWEIGIGHNISAEENQASKELRVFERYQYLLSEVQARHARCNWSYRHGRMHYRAGRLDEARRCFLVAKNSPRLKSAMISVFLYGLIRLGLGRII